MESVKKNPQQPAVRDVSAEEVLEKKGQLFLVDVRTSEELVGELGKIEGIHHVPLDQIGGRFTELPKDRTIVFVCRSGGRSAAATAFVQDQGYDVYNMEGGMLRWNEKDLPVVRGS